MVCAPSCVACDAVGYYFVYVSSSETHRDFVDVNLVPSPTGMRGIGRGRWPVLAC